ncbi:MAG: hypothetical protein QOK88_08950 [Nitrososphaeraceae archaeon]|nr:hypothetical protein [Nitrososphaeraceae archaeon]MDW0135610.1 hypothetical protein [Nitrososphaeraceae archaeon]
MRKYVNLFLLSLSLSIFLITSVVTIQISAQEDQGQTNSSIVKFLFIQHGESGSISKINSTTYSLQLNDLAENVILFSDRPNRIVDTQSIQEFIGNWTQGEDSFEIDPPNAALTFLEDDNQKIDALVIELYNIEYDEEQNILKYDFTFLDNTTAASLPDLPYKTGESILVIDSVPYSITVINRSGESGDMMVFQKHPDEGN